MDHPWKPESVGLPTSLEVSTALRFLAKDYDYPLIGFAAEVLRQLGDLPLDEEQQKLLAFCLERQAQQLQTQQPRPQD